MVLPQFFLLPPITQDHRSAGRSRAAVTRAIGLDDDRFLKSGSLLFGIKRCFRRFHGYEDVLSQCDLGCYNRNVTSHDAQRRSLANSQAKT
ncbi:MAG: hypothetical protein QF408_15100 [Pirellulales bacterium]|nr:hypothetical protein [Pirellulales bacterium]